MADGDTQDIAQNAKKYWSAEGGVIREADYSAVDPNTLAWDGFGFEQTLAVVATMFSIGNAATMG